MTPKDTANANVSAFSNDLMYPNFDQCVKTDSKNLVNINNASSYRLIGGSSTHAKLDMNEAIITFHLSLDYL